MKFETKLKVRLYTAVGLIIIGVILMAIAYMTNEDELSSIGFTITVIGIARIVQNKRITMNDDTLRKRIIAETDERNIMLWTQARSLAFSVFIIAAAVAEIVLFAIGLDIYAKAVAFVLFGFVVIYWICYFIVSRKY